MRGRRWASVVTTVVALVSAMVGIDGGTVADATVRRAVDQRRRRRDRGRARPARYVPTSFRSRCRDQAASFDDLKYSQAIVTSFSASLNCLTVAGDRVFYWKFDNREGADAFLETVVSVDSYTDASTKLSDCPSATTYSTGEGKQERRGGRVFCFLGGAATDLPEGTPIVQWTDERLGIVAQAFNVDDPEHVHRFFARDSGPLAKPDRAGIPTATSAAARRSEGRALLALVPKASARGAPSSTISRVKRSGVCMSGGCGWWRTSTSARPMTVLQRWNTPASSTPIP